ncbi:MAG: hypothetical protein KBB52_01030 [Candidatus Omnitrophica bacterium]|nr:hypothetical protein [Candidatus Omnitrophota bacterium]
MKLANIIVISLVCVSLAFVVGCGVSKDKYKSLLNEKVGLEEKVAVLTKAKDAMKAEYDNLLKEKMDLSTQVQTLTNEKAALKGEYDKLLDEKVALKAAYDKLQAENQELQVRLAGSK